MAIRVVVSAEDVAKEAALIIAAKAEAAAQKGRPLTIALSGGSTPKALYRLLAAPPYREGIDWEYVHFFFGDERCVGPGDEESNFRMAQLNLLNDIEVPARNVHRIEGELAPEEAAVRYENDIKESFKGFDDTAGGYIKDGLPVFDIVLLGLGSDGHTLSIFPDDNGSLSKNGLASLCESGRLVVDTDGPCRAGSPDEKGEGRAGPGKSPDVRRITMTTGLVNNARLIIFMVVGRDKAEAVTRVIDGGEAGTPEPPASRIKPVSGELLWLLDDKAAALLD
ncbi:6-phosphogluconolactonase, eukaryotic type [hydrothermal vent metagenome]|uniref:6-phosphogluconolactonase, eukaryotic type n=1 Tax=hydrothermal vent metagenome TaxID=652676 RepID=A0A3B0V8Q8_9ZZZZ